MKRFVYIACFTILGLLLSTLLHAAVEWPLLYVFTNYPEYAESIVWREWELFHGIGAFGLWFLGFVGGVWCGVRFWRILYIEERYGTPRF